MHIFTLEHSKTAYRVDFALYCAIVMGLAVFLMVNGPREQRVEIIVFALAGLISWTAIEYVLHRFVLHGLQPFRRWHEEHHRRPMALIFTPTILSATLIVILIFIPALLVFGLWCAFALTLGADRISIVHNYTPCCSPLARRQCLAEETQTLACSTSSSHRTIRLLRRNQLIFGSRFW